MVSGIEIVSDSITLLTFKARSLILILNFTTFIFLFFPELLKGSKKNNRVSPIEGVLDYSTIFYYGRNKKMNVVKFKIRIRDRALNVSNVIESDTISIPLTI